MIPNDSHIFLKPRVKKLGFHFNLRTSTTQL